MRGYVEESLEIVASRELRAAARLFVAAELRGKQDEIVRAELELADAAKNYVICCDPPKPSKARKLGARR